MLAKVRSAHFCAKFSQIFGNFEARAAASLVWNHKEMGREDEETELEQYLEERRERGRQKREKVNKREGNRGMAIPSFGMEDLS